ncbi:modulator of macroautophagy TMEM150B isoform X2 [Orcinus orca]|uniref:modulator of macroautophagy TMEM150B isoform X2 n=1 Tax=Orcinus orca TaxID=9733 RepID=UPI002112B181|nr:modulator of macroautophagy TMEM150B isoform X2 [Orcinus orca]
MWGYLSLLPAFLAFWATAGIWTVFSLAVANKAVNLTEGFPYISRCGNSPPQSCIFSQVLNLGAALAAWTCILRYHQLRDWGVGKWPNQLILWTGLLCTLGTSIVGNFQVENEGFIPLIFYEAWASLVAQWLRICLPMQGTQVQALVQEDPTCSGATKPMRHNPRLRSRAREPKLLSLRATTTEARVPRACAPQQEKPPQ